jgi:hypothetical protein
MPSPAIVTVTKPPAVRVAASQSSSSVSVGCWMYSLFRGAVHRSDASVKGVAGRVPWTA